MLDKKMHEKLNEQIQEEMFSAYLYLAMSAWAEDNNYTGAAAWFSSQAQEEMVHAMKFYNYIIERGEPVELLELKKPQKEWKSLLQAYEDALAHEKHITGKIHDLVNLAIELKDHGTNQMLQWFVEEQIEEEASADEVIQKLKMVKDAPGGLYMIDKELGQRPLIFTMPQGE